MPMFTQIVAIGCLGWYAAVALVTTLGSFQIFRHYRRPPNPPVSSHLEQDHVPHITVIRPCKGLEPFLYDCLASIFHQDYPRSKFTVHFCVSSESDPAYKVLQQLVEDYAAYDVRIYVEDEDPVVQGQTGIQFGPNPKIRNMSRAYREAKGDVVWILDCNIWVGYGALGRMVDKLCGFHTSSSTGPKSQTKRPYKLVAHLPVCVDVDNLAEGNSRDRSVSASASDHPSTVPFIPSRFSSGWITGSMLETSFLSTAHAKMYVAINSVSIAPCINGKSTMFRRSHLDYLTKGQGIDYFSHNICEDHLIGDLLWKSKIPANIGFDGVQDREISGSEVQKTNPMGLEFRNHGLAVGDLAIQPVARMSVTSYIARRVRWLRVRKFTVMLATLVEPGTESILCSAMGAFAVTTLDGTKSMIGGSWSTMAIFFTVSLACWGAVDYFVSGILQGMGSVERVQPQQSTETQIAIPAFAHPFRRRLSKWLPAWIGRETFALPIWTWAIWGGTTVTWRDKKFWVGMDMRVHEMAEPMSAQFTDVQGEHTVPLSYGNGRKEDKAD